jgi:hypothetical protein
MTKPPVTRRRGTRLHLEALEDRLPLAGALDGHGPAPLRWSTAAEAPPQLGIASSEEVLATFSGEVADRHPPTGPTTDAVGVEHSGKEGVRLLTWGDPYLAAWLEAVRGEPLVEADYVAAGLAPGSNPM